MKVSPRGPTVMCLEKRRRRVRIHSCRFHSMNIQSIKETHSSPAVDVLKYESIVLSFQAFSGRRERLHGDSKHSVLSNFKKAFRFTFFVCFLDLNLAEMFVKRGSRFLCQFKIYILYSLFYLTCFMCLFLID